MTKLENRFTKFSKEELKLIHTALGYVPISSGYKLKLFQECELELKRRYE